MISRHLFDIIVIGAGPAGSTAAYLLASHGYRVLILDKSTVSRTVDSLVKAKLIDRKENPNDRRSVELVLTGEGKKRAANIHMTCDDRYALLLSQFENEDKEIILKAVNLLGNKMAELRKNIEGGCC